MDISIITTTFNRKSFLQKTIESVQASVLIPLNVSWEHIIYDDGSTDGTEELMAQMQPSHTTYIRGIQQRGQSYGKNKAIERASGKYILVIDSDDILLVRTLHNFLSLALAHPEVDWFISDFLHVDENLRYLIERDYYGWKFKNREEMLEAIFKGEHYLQTNVFFKKDVYIKAGKFDESMSMGEDLDLYIRFLRLGSFPLYSSFISHLHREHVGNISREMIPQKHKIAAEALRKKYFQK